MFLVRPFLTMAPWSRLDYGVHTWTEWGHLRPIQLVKLMQYSSQMILLLCIFGAFLYFCTKLSDKLGFFVFLYKAIWQMRGCRQAEHASDQEQCGRSNACISYLSVWGFELCSIFVVVIFWIVLHICRSYVLNCVPCMLLMCFELYFISVVAIFWIVLHICPCSVCSVQFGPHSSVRTSVQFGPPRCQQLEVAPWASFRFKLLGR